MRSESPNLGDHSRTLSQALRAIRKHRGLRAAEVAEAMHMPLRTYEHFESGRGRVNLPYIHRFAQVTDSDPFAILASLSLGSSRFAWRCADNKLMMIMMMALQDYDELLGDRIAGQHPRTLIKAFTDAFRALAEHEAQRERIAAGWIQPREDRLGQVDGRGPTDRDP